MADQPQSPEEVASPPHLQLEPTIQRLLCAKFPGEISNAIAEHFRYHRTCSRISTHAVYVPASGTSPLSKMILYSCGYNKTAKNATNSQRQIRAIAFSVRITPVGVVGSGVFDAEFVLSFGVNRLVLFPEEQTATQHTETWWIWKDDSEMGWMDEEVSQWPVLVYAQSRGQGCRFMADKVELAFYTWEEY